MLESKNIDIDIMVSLPTRGAWIEMYRSPDDSEYAVKSLPTRGAWIEMIQ